jgi:hypothetical protein
MPRVVRPRLDILSGSGHHGNAGLEMLAQTEVRQDGADYNRRSAKWKEISGNWQISSLITFKR